MSHGECRFAGSAVLACHCMMQLRRYDVQILVSHIHSASLQAQLRDEEELSNLISAKMHMRTDAPAFRQTREG